jgi:hypothetical protein
MAPVVEPSVPFTPGGAKFDVVFTMRNGSEELPLTVDEFRATPEIPVRVLPPD